MPDLKTLTEKWDEVLNEQSEAPIADDYRAKVTAQVLENQEKAIMEAAPGTGTGQIDNYDPILIKLARRMTPKLIAFDVCGVQPMSGPTGLVFAMRAKYGAASDNGDEALHDKFNTAHSGAGTHAGSDPFEVDANGNPTMQTGHAMDTATAEAGDTWGEMSMTIEKTNVAAQSRQLRANYSIELAQDLKAVHGLDADNELSNILAGEIIGEINREIIRNVYRIAMPGADFTTQAGVFDLDVDSDGRWSVEKFKGLIFAIERDANRIAMTTRRGKGNVLICSSDVASALSLAGVLDHAPALEKAGALEVDITGTTFAGVYRGKMKVFIDPFATGDFYVVAYRGSSQYDAGFYYCPYVGLQKMNAVDSKTMQPVIGFKTRYGTVANPYTNMNTNGNAYYRKVKVTNLL